MVHLKSCWSPCFWYGDVMSGSLAVSVYTIAMSICLICYTINIMSGGDSSQLWLPFFETNLNSTTQPTGGFIIIFFILLLFASVLLCYGVRREVRGFMLPWMVLLWVAIFFQCLFGLWLVFGYYIYLEVIMAAVCDWIWMAFNIYCYYVVRSHYRNLKHKQNPDIEYVNDMWMRSLQNITQMKCMLCIKNKVNAKRNVYYFILKMNKVWK